MLLFISTHLTQIFFSHWRKSLTLNVKLNHHYWNKYTIGPFITMSFVWIDELVSENFKTFLCQGITAEQLN